MGRHTRKHTIRQEFRVVISRHHDLRSPWLVSARLFLRAIRARALVAAAAGACLADHGEMILTDSRRGPSAAVPEARLRQVPEVVDAEAP
jgi:hypothetical protein